MKCHETQESKPRHQEHKHGTTGAVIHGPHPNIPAITLPHTPRDAPIHRSAIFLQGSAAASRPRAQHHEELDVWPNDTEDQHGAEDEIGPEEPTRVNTQKHLVASDWMLSQVALRSRSGPRTLENILAQEQKEKRGGMKSVC